MNKSQRIRVDINNPQTDKYIKARLEQDVNTLEFLSLKLETKEAYQDSNADYGVLVGRVVANGAVGIPNVKISVFIPLDENDENDGDIVSIYPYKTPRDKNNEGKRYNLLPRVGKINPKTKLTSPKQPFGSFPIKEEIVTNPTYLEVYKKYYKYSTVTNDAGDYMIFGIPTGSQTIHMSADITDIGPFSMTPASMVTNLGYSPNLFIDNNTRIKPSTDLDDLPHIETQEVTVDVLPFWGDEENFIIGITRQDFRIRAELVNTFTIFGTAFTDGDNAMWGGDTDTGLQPREFYRAKSPTSNTIGAFSKRIGKITENIYYYPNTVSDSEIPNADPRDEMRKLYPTEYTAHKRDGDFVFIINCNRRKVITDEFGNQTPVPDSSDVGAYTQFKGFMTVEIDEDEIPMDFGNDLSDKVGVYPYRYKIKIPQSTSIGNTFDTNDDSPATQSWRKDHFTFLGGSLYSVAKFHGTVANTSTDRNSFNNDALVNKFFLNPEDGDKGDQINFGYLENNSQDDNPLDFNVGIIQTNDAGGITGNSSTQMVNNAKSNATNKEFFGANWLNFSIYLNQNGYINEEDFTRLRDMQSNTHQNSRPKGHDFLRDNTQNIAAGDFNTKWFARSDLHYTDFIKVPPQDIINILNEINTKKGFKSSEIGTSLEGNYKNGLSPCPFNGGRKNADPTKTKDPEIYFFRGFDTADCLEYLVRLGIIQ